jgi:hypothetical protein
VDANDSLFDELPNNKARDKSGLWILSADDISLAVLHVEVDVEEHFDILKKKKNEIYLCPTREAKRP